MAIDSGYSNNSNNPLWVTIPICSGGGYGPGYGGPEGGGAAGPHQWGRRGAEWCLLIGIIILVILL